ncbi:MAG: flagellar basal-body MS-ring/collar protein FliF [Terriglobia bacterium]
MATETNPVIHQLKLLNDKLSINQKLSIFVLAAVVFAGMSVLIYFMNQEDYQTLYSNLSAEEASTVVNKLKELKVTYQLADAGRSVRVPAARVDELRIQLASEGLPQSGKIGFEIFDKTNLGMTEFLEKVSYKRALEGELSRTILSLKEIAEARVHLVLPKESLFQEKAEPTKASVVVKLNSGKQLNEGVVSGIVHLVASAVEGLSPENVTVLDSSGRLLSSRHASSEEALSSTQMELKTRAEKELTAKIINILEPVVGEGRVKADTSVVLDFNRSEQTEEKYDPQQNAIRSQQKNQEQSQPIASGTAAGVPGTTSNQANPAPNFIPLSGRLGSSFSKQSETTNYEVSKVIRHTIEPVGDVKRLSVAVIVDDAVKTEPGSDGNPVKKTVPRSADDLKKIKDLVSAAIGIDTGRGDMLTVENVSFDVQSTSLDTRQPSFNEKWKDLIRPALRYGSFLLLFLMAYLFLVRPVSKKILSPVEGILSVESGNQPKLAESPAGGTHSLETPKTIRELEAALNAEDGNMLEPKLNIRKSDILKTRIVDFIRREPEHGAQLIRAWLTEDGK